MDLTNSYNYCRSMKYAGMEYPALVSNLLPSEKHDAIAACFASFRYITDEVIDLLKQQKPSDSTRENAMTCINEWMKTILNARENTITEHEIQPALADVFSKYNIPLRPWVEFKRFLEFHLENNQIRDTQIFEKYARWAYKPPVEAFLHILTSDKSKMDQKQSFNPEFIASELGMLFFIVHTLADIPADLKSTSEGFIFLPMELLRRHGLDHESLQRFSSGNSIDENFHNVIDEMYHFGREYEMFCREKLVIIRGHIGREEWFILDLLVNIYANFLYRIWEYPEAIFQDGYPLDPAMVYINALKLQKDMGLSFERDLSRLLVDSIA